jgi:hypothetical protein
MRLLKLKEYLEKYTSRLLARLQDEQLCDEELEEGELILETCEAVLENISYDHPTVLVGSKVVYLEDQYFTVVGYYSTPDVPYGIVCTDFDDNLWTLSEGEVRPCSTP